ncbi:gp 1.05, partial [Enterobacteria phage T7M]
GSTCGRIERTYS